MSLLAALLALGTFAADDSYVAGYLILPTGERVPAKYNQGFSMHVAAWPLLPYYPGHRYQTGLPGTWMFAQHEDRQKHEAYSDVEGGLGWWTDTRFPTPTPKFIMGGVGPDFSEIANGPSHGAGDWKEPRGLYGVAQLSPWLLFPIDGLNLKQGTCGEWFGYGYLNLPLCEPKQQTAGQPIPTGGNTWTLFLDTANFKGPAAFFLPYFWSHSYLKRPELMGRLLDSCPAEPNTAIQMETQYVPCQVAETSIGEKYARVAPVGFPENWGRNSALIQQSTSYSKDALYDSVKAWFSGSSPSSGKVDPKGAFVRSFTGKGYATWEVRQRGDGDKERRQKIKWEKFAQQTTSQRSVLGYTWNLEESQVKLHAGRVELPQYYKIEKGFPGEKDVWTPIPEADVPDETHLKEVRWAAPKEPQQEPYSTPQDKVSTWRSPGPSAGPFRTRLGDGTTVTYYWYRFADQPALLNADLTKAEREALQAKVEKIHRAWTKDKQYLPPIESGRLASIDPALIVSPPKGMEVGYVPIVVRQELKK